MEAKEVNEVAQVHSVVRRATRAWVWVPPEPGPTSSLGVLGEKAGVCTWVLGEGCGTWWPRSPTESPHLSPPPIPGAFDIDSVEAPLPLSCKHGGGSQSGERPGAHSLTVTLGHHQHPHPHLQVRTSASQEEVSPS